MSLPTEHLAEGQAGAKHSIMFPRTGKKQATAALLPQAYSNLHILLGGQATSKGRQGSKIFGPGLCF